jgi:hypothetical protein
MALGAGLKKGGVAKGELVLAMYELANCFRNGWGIKKDPVAAKQYYETAANLGDTDAMNEVAWCYLEGFGTKKDKVSKHSRSHVHRGNVSPSPVCISVYATEQLSSRGVFLRHSIYPSASFVGQHSGEHG